MSIIQQGKTYHLRKRVPKRYARIESRREIWQTLKTDSYATAQKKYAEVWEQMLNGWEALLAGDSKAAEARFESAKNLSETRGVRYLPVEQVLNLPVRDIVDRVDKSKGVRNSAFGIEAFLGIAKPPPMTLTRALELFFDSTKDRIKGKTADQTRRWRNPRIKALKNLVAVIGDKDIFAITREDMLAFWRRWEDRMEHEGLTANSANKDIGHIVDVLKTLKKLYQWKHDFPLGDLKFKDDGGNKRPPFSEDWIKRRLLGDGVLNGLNREARLAFLILLNTGARPSEITGLMPKHFLLDENIPHITIRPEGRQLKSKRASRDIPLVGVSLEAARAVCHEAFPTYQFKDAFSDTVNKFLRSNGLMETPRHTVYSLRHSFEDRLICAGVDERVRADLMGHSFSRPEYGEGGGLVMKQQALLKISL